MDVIVTSTVLNAADQFAFMQQTLLMQIFRLNHSQVSPTTDSSGSNNGANGNGSSQMPSVLAQKCPTCIAFSDRCCQEDNGYRLFEEFIEANLHYCVWDQSSSDALYSLRYQGYVCPGIMVMIANSSHLELMADLWKRQLLTAPRGTRISQVGLSTGCVVRPVPVSHSVSLHDVLCLILARLKQRCQVADMNTIIEAVNQDWSSLVSRMKLQEAELRDTVHSSLGALIKQRKVYYTGNKGYFLVGPADNTVANGANGTQVTSGNNANPTVGCASGLFGGLNGNSNENGGMTSVTSLGSRISQFRHSMRAGSTNGSNNSTSPDTSLQNRSSPLRSVEGQDQASGRSPGEASGSSSNSSPNSSFNLERSQSLRISKKSLRSLSSKGGSLRLSKKEAATALKQVKEAEESESNCNGELTESTLATPHQTGAPTTTTSVGNNGSNSKSFERKNSFLSKLFSSSSNSNGGSPASKKSTSTSGSAGSSGGQNGTKPILATFSAQFPPAELQLQDPNAIYQQLIPASQRPPQSSQPPQISQQPQFQPPLPTSRSPISNGGYNSSCESNMSGSGNASPQVRVNNGINMNNIRGNQQQQSLYSMGSSSNYGYARLQQQQQKGHYLPLPTRQPHEANNSVYSAPPPPLPYRPPPPNPYNLPYNNVNNNLRPSPTNMRLSPSPPSITGSTPPPHGGNHGSTHGGTPPSMAIYARVSNLKKVINNGGMGHNNGGMGHNNGGIVKQNKQITSQSQGNGNGNASGNSTVRNVRFADEQNGSATSSTSSSAASTSGGSGSSGPSSIESVQRNSNNSGLYDKTLVVIEKSNKELEKNLTLAASEVNVTSLQQPQQQPQTQTPSKQPPLLIRPRLVDTIHNNKNSLATEIIYEVEPGSSQENSVIIGSSSSHQPQQKPPQQQQQQQSQSQNGPNFLQKQPLNGSASNSGLRTDVLLRSASQAQLNQLKNQDIEGNSSVAPSYPSLSDLSIADLSSFKSLTAQKLMAGLSFNSIDTLLEVNAAAEARSKLNESTETVDFGII